MIEKYVANLAARAGVKLSKVSIEDVCDCTDAGLLNLSSGKKQVSTIIYHLDLDDLKRKKPNDRMKMMVGQALEQLR